MVVRSAESVPRAVASEAPIVILLRRPRSLPPAALILIILLILLFPASARAQQRGGDSSSAIVRGRVTTEGKPAPGVVVTLSGHDGDAGRRQFACETDAEGRFNFVGAPPGSYEIESHAYVFVLAKQSPSARSNQRIVVGAGETIDDLSIELVRGGVVTGRVIDEDGRPVVGGNVWLQRLPDDPATIAQFGSRSFHGTGETDDRGVYRLFGVPAGRYLVAVGQQFDGRGASYQVFYPGTTDQSKAKVIEVSAGAEKTEIDITVVPPDKTYAASGRLIEAANGKPIPGGYIGCQPLDNDHVKMSTLTSSREFRITGNDGSFRLVGLRPGQYRLLVLPASEGGIEWYSDDVIIDVADEDLSGIELKAHLGASISGVITIEGAKDTKFPGTFNNSYVSAHLRNSEGRSGEGAICIIGPNGGFRLTGLRAGEFLLDVSAQGISRRRHAIQRVEVAGQLVRGAIELKEGQSVSDARIVLAYGDGVVRGRIRFQNGEPPKNLCFYVTADRKGECDECRASIHSPVSAGGQYMLEGLPPGDYELTLHAHSCGMGVMPPIAPIKQMARVANGVEASADFVVDLNKRDQ